MALGGALTEELPVERGRLGDASLTRYLVPRFGGPPRDRGPPARASDLPPAGAGKTPMIAVAPAVANAIFAATGRRLRDLPLTQGGRLP